MTPQRRAADHLTSLSLPDHRPPGWARAHSTERLARQIEAEYTASPAAYAQFLALLIHQPPRYEQEAFLLAVYLHPDPHLALDLRDWFRESMLQVCTNLALTFQLLDTLEVQPDATERLHHQLEQGPGGRPGGTEQCRLR